MLTPARAVFPPVADHDAVEMRVGWQEWLGVEERVQRRQEIDQLKIFHLFSKFSDLYFQIWLFFTLTIDQLI